MIISGILFCFGIGCVFILVSYLCTQAILIAGKDIPILFVTIIFWLIVSSICFSVIAIVLQQISYMRGV